MKFFYLILFFFVHLSCSEAKAPRENHTDVATPVLVTVTTGMIPISISIKNPTPVPQTLDPVLQIEVFKDGKWQLADTASTLRVRSSCEDSALQCVDIKAGDNLEVVGWDGMLGDTQCGCEECYRAAPGQYRIIAKTCDGGQSFTSQDFEYKGLTK